MGEPGGWETATWDGSRRFQLRRWAELSLDEILDAQEEMAKFAVDISAAPSRQAGVIREKSASYGAEKGTNDIPLPGCTPEPLMAYLKALGILRLVAEQKDPEARGWWKNDVFHLRSTLEREGLIKFFLEEYKPTPILAPWAGGSGFFGKDNDENVEAIKTGKSPRVSDYASVIRAVQKIIKDEKIGAKPRDEEKSRLIRRYRRELSDETLVWMDAAMVLQEEGQAFAPLLGTGGNDGRLDFTQNFMGRIVTLRIVDKNSSDFSESRSWLNHALIAVPAVLRSASVGQFAPGRAGGPNATQGMEGDALDNPWDFVLMLEGALLFAGAAVKRLGIVEDTRSAFPFTVRQASSGFVSASSKEEDGSGSRGEIWLPTWKRPARFEDIQKLFGEARTEVGSRTARNGVDFGRAIADFGVDRGIQSFHRLAFLKRSGKAYLATPLGKFNVTANPAVDYLREVDVWTERFRRAAGDKYSPPRFGTAYRRYESAIFEFCKYGGANLFQEILMSLGEAERVLSVGSGKFRDEKFLKPLNRLSSEWIKAADDGSVEYVVARALSSIYDPEKKIGPLRANLEPVDWKKNCRDWAEKDRSVIWNAANLTANLGNVLKRRLMDGTRAGCGHLPLASASTVPLNAVSLFIAGHLDDERIEELMWGLMLVDGSKENRIGFSQVDAPPLPRAYALLKLLFLPSSVAIKGQGETGLAIRSEPIIPQLLDAGRLGEACAVATRRLRASGFVPMPRPIRGLRVRDMDWSELDGVDSKRLSAALLMPISGRDVGRLMKLVLGEDDRDGKAV
jgi:CRISPR-associated protein Csx17